MLKTKRLMALTLALSLPFAQMAAAKSPYERMNDIIGTGVVMTVGGLATAVVGVVVFSDGPGPGLDLLNYAERLSLIETSIARVNEISDNELSPKLKKTAIENYEAQRTSIVKELSEAGADPTKLPIPEAKMTEIRSKILDSVAKNAKRQTKFNYTVGSGFALFVAGIVLVVISPALATGYTTSEIEARTKLASAGISYDEVVSKAVISYVQQQSLLHAL